MRMLTRAAGVTVLSLMSDHPDAHRALVDGFAAGPIAQLVLDPAGDVAFCTARMRDMFGVAERHIGRPLSELELSRRPVELRPLIELATRTDRPARANRVRWRSHGGSERILDVIVVSTGRDGRLTGTSIAFVDVTEQSALSAELEVAYEELESTADALRATNRALAETHGRLESACGRLLVADSQLQAMREQLRIRCGRLDRLQLVADAMLEDLCAMAAAADGEPLRGIGHARATTLPAGLHEHEPERHRGSDAPP